MFTGIAIFIVGFEGGLPFKLKRRGRFQEDGTVCTEAVKQEKASSAQTESQSGWHELSK